MKNSIKHILLASLLASAPTAVLAVDGGAAGEQNIYNLACQPAEECLNQDFKLGRHDFTIAPGSVIKVEVKAPNGAAIKVQTGNSVLSSSYMHIATPNETVSQHVELESDIAQDGKFSIEVQVAKVMVNGKDTSPAEPTYNLKITRLAQQKPDDAL